jgi:hypothetical protein
MSTIYNAALMIAIQAQGISLEGGGVVSALPSKLLVCVGNTNILQVEGMFDLQQEAYWFTAATLSGTLIDQYGNVITTVALAYASGSNGNFSASFGGLQFYPVVARGYTMLLQGLSDWGNAFSLPILAEVVQVPIVPGISDE